MVTVLLIVLLVLLAAGLGLAVHPLFWLVLIGAVVVAAVA